MQAVPVFVPRLDFLASSLASRKIWPNLIVHELSQVVPFLDPADLGPDGKPKAVIDLMQPWGKFQETILKRSLSDLNAFWSR